MGSQYGNFLGLWSLNSSFSLILGLWVLALALNLIMNPQCHSTDIVLAGDHVKVPIKQNLYMCEIYHLKYMIPKIEMFGVKIDNFTTLQICTILPLKMIFELRAQNTR